MILPLNYVEVCTDNNYGFLMAYCTLFSGDLPTLVEVRVTRLHGLGKPANFCEGIHYIYHSAEETLKWCAKQFRLNQHFTTAKEVQAAFSSQCMPLLSLNIKIWTAEPEPHDQEWADAEASLQRSFASYVNNLAVKTSGARPWACV